MNPLVLLFGVVAALGAAVMTGLIGGRGLSSEEKYASRLSKIEDHSMTLEEIEMARPFTERILFPLRDRVVAAVRRRTPATQQQELRSLILRAGRPYGLSVEAVLALKAAFAVLATALFALLLLPFMGLRFPLNLLGVLAGLGGFMLPDQYLKQQAGKRRQKIEDVIPDTIDLLTICLDAGLTFDAGIQRLAEKVEGPLREELATTLMEIRYGQPRADALQALAARVRSEDLSAFLDSVVQSQQLGVSLGDTVRIQAAEIRRRRRVRAEEKAAQASLKMLFPMIGCIFPTLFIALMGPVALILLNAH